MLPLLLFNQVSFVDEHFLMSTCFCPTGLPPQHLPPGSYYGQMDHHGLANTHGHKGYGGGHHSSHAGHHGENGHDNFTDFVSLVCHQQDAAAAAAGQHLAASAAISSGAGGGHPGPVRSPYSSASSGGYLPPTIPPTSIAAQHASSRASMTNVRSNGK